MSLDDRTRERIESFIESNRVALFMKGNREAPQCGFSATVVRILDTLVPDYATFDVLSDHEVREGVKEFSSWPTIPQLYVAGEFVGGCDIVQELFGSGELHQTLGLEMPGEVRPPSIQVSDRAAEALERALAQQGGDGRALHLSIDARFQTHLHLGPVGPGTVRTEAGGIAFHLDPMSARRADGIRIDVDETPQGPVFRIDNPNAPKVREIGPDVLRARLDAGERIELLDVRTPEERAVSDIEGSVLLSEPEVHRVESLPRDSVLVFYDRGDGRSRAAAEHFAALGFGEVYELAGGIDAWSRLEASGARG